jgi:hypothetical protein
MTNTPRGWVPDSGLDAHSVASMTPDEAKEYLELLIRYFRASKLPSLAWLRRATMASRKSDSHSNSRDALTLYGSQSPAAGNEASRRKTAVGLLQALLRRAPVDFRGSCSSRQNPRRRPKTTTVPRRRRVGR